MIVRLPLASGVLSGSMSVETQFAENDHRHYNRDGAALNVGETFAGLPFEKAVQLACELRAFVPEGMSLAEMAQRWILDHAAVTTVITCASRPDQVRMNAATSKGPSLPQELHAQLRDFYQSKVSACIRGPY